MESIALHTFLVSTGLFAAALILTGIERGRSRRIIIGRIRSGLDIWVVKGYRKLSDLWHHFARYVLQLGWYYSLHALLQTLLKTLTTSYEYIERVFEKNRGKALLLRAERRGKSVGDNHLTQMAEHKVETTLTPDEKKKLRNKKLEERH